MLKNLQALRFIFAFCIYLHHLDLFETGGDLGVSFFLILSGFSLMYGYEKKFSHQISTTKTISKNE